MRKYDHKKIESKWQKVWEKEKPNKAKDNSKKPKYYCLIEFPYPSGDGLHVGHIRSSTAMDIISRKRRREGKNVLYPIGWDAFGLPTENYAIKTGIHPAKVTKDNTDNFRKQLKSLGFSFDWDREINTTDPDYYKWTQWIFLQFFKKDLAYKAKIPINWCLSCKIGLANEEVVDGFCERCSGPTEKREKEQWMLAITKYADRLEEDLEKVDYEEKIKVQQRNWIGRSEGAEIEFPIKGTKEKIKVFTTRPDTLFGATYMVLAPESVIVEKLKEKISNFDEVEKYIKETKKKTEMDRVAEGREKTGVELKGIKAINPANKEEIPIFIADYVMASYGTGAIMAVPAHDGRDFEFAQKFSLPIKEVVVPERIDKRNPPVEGKASKERRNVHAIVRNPESGKIIYLKWKKHPWNTFPMGGVEDGEDIIEAARREVLEETGYSDLTEGKIMGGQVKAEYFAAHKDENRVSYTSLVTFDLKSDKKEKISEEEDGIHEVLWGDMKDLTTEFMTHAEMDIWLSRMEKEEGFYTGEGVLINSGEFSGLSNEEGKNKITKFVKGKEATTYKLHDWVFSRQRYWGEPIPIINCEKCGFVPVPEEDLPVVLPEVEKYQPTDIGESPLAAISEWVEVKCPKCEGDAKRETDTMPNWAGSSWYYLRYVDPHNKKAFAGEKALQYWTPVDWYNGGMEHTTLHLLYSRFWHKFLFDIGVVPTDEPYARRTSHGLILAEGGEKMSKSKGNVINPDDIVKNYGADALRLYEMFMGPFREAISWSTDSIAGSYRFLERLWRLREKVENIELTGEIEIITNQSIKKVSEDIEEMKFNTAVSQLMIFLNRLEKEDKVSLGAYRILLQIVAPFAPHISEEIWQEIGEKSSIHAESWPTWNKNKITDNRKIIVIQIDGKVRGQFEIVGEINETEAREKALAESSVEKWLSGKKIKKFIYIPNRLVSIVI